MISWATYGDTKTELSEMVHLYLIKISMASCTFHINPTKHIFKPTHWKTRQQNNPEDNLTVQCDLRREEIEERERERKKKQLYISFLCHGVGEGGCWIDSNTLLVCFTSIKDWKWRCRTCTSMSINLMLPKTQHFFFSSQINKRIY